MKKFLSILFSLLLVLSIVGCKNNESEDSDGKVKAILIEGSIKMNVGDYQDLVKKVYPETGVYDSVDWSSSDESVLTVVQGRVTALKEGNAQIIATARDGSNVKGTIGIVVKAKAIPDPTGISLMINDVEYRDGATIELTELDEVKLDIKYLPDANVRQGVSLSISNNNGELNDNTLICKAPGKFELYVFSTYGDIEQKYNFKVKEKHFEPESIEINSSTSTIESDMELRVTAKVLPERADQGVVWSTSDKTIATVDEYGNVKALKAGTVKIIATSKEINTVLKEFNLTITQALPFDKTIIYVNPEYTKVGETVKIGDKTLVIGKGAQSTIKGALNICDDGATIYLAAGTYKEDVNWEKNITVIGPNANVLGFETREAEAIYQLSDKGALVSKTLKFVGVEILGGGPEYYGATSGVYFKSDSTTSKVEFENCYIHEMKTAIRFDKGNKLELNVTGCKISGIGQFFIWTTGGMSKTTLVNNYIDASSSGQVVNAAGTLIRVRSGIAFLYNNYFNGTPSKNAGLFENGSADGNYVIMFNTFNNCTKYVYNNGSKPVIFDKNLYLDASGKVLDASPSAIKVGGVTADTVVAKSAEEVANFYAEFIK